jgi:heme exporter protein CcmD
MISNFITMNGYGLYVWLSFGIVFISCAVVYYRTKRTLKKYEQEFLV